MKSNIIYILLITIGIIILIFILKNTLWQKEFLDNMFKNFFGKIFGS
ncbi:MAG: hypothetical protein J6M39_02990 [Lachnospiraceae bacterium]|nr:hypothetical protein [Lachnospiraceae bacterium]